MAGGDPGCALDVVVEAIDRHCQLVGIEGEPPLFVEVLLDELAQRLDRRAGRLQRDRVAARAGAARRQARHLDRDQREQSAHGDTKARAREKALIVQSEGQLAKAVALGLAERHHRLGCEPFEARERFAPPIAIASPHPR